MLNFICKNLLNVKFSAKISPTHKPNFTQIHQLSASNEQQPSFTVSYLINTCGFSKSTALKASKYVKFDKPDIPDSVIEFFKQHDFTITQISSLVKKRPTLLVSNPNKTLLPKLQYLTSKGISNSDVAAIISGAPHILKRSLKNQIIPTFGHLGNVLNSQENVLATIKRFPSLLLYNPQNYLIPSIEILRELGAPESNIVFLLKNQPRIFRITPKSFKETVEKVQKMGFDPQRVTFVLAIHALRSMSKITWAKKVAAYKKWGLSENDVMVAFGRSPWCITVSEDKIEKIMDFVVNTIGWDSSLVIRWPLIMSLSLEKRIIPRCLVYQFLLSKGLIKNDISVSLLLKSPDNCFVDRFVKPFEEVAPELLKIYKAN